MNIVLFGAGACARYIMDVDGNGVVAIADNDEAKWGTSIKGVPVLSPKRTMQHNPGARWVASAISRPAAPEIREQLRYMGVLTKPLWEILPVFHGLPSATVRYSLSRIAGDEETLKLLRDQYQFRFNPDYDMQLAPLDSKEIYFPDFIQKRDDEHFVDCGACDGDTVKAFQEHWESYRHIVAFEPDRKNWAKLMSCYDPEKVTIYRRAVSDFNGDANFTSNGDYSSHMAAEGGNVECTTLDSAVYPCSPTYIKMDIEGSELEALWGARKILEKHSPVLAICAYHTSEHLWQIPMLIHALQPEYKLFLRRYAEGAFETVWYAVPPERLR